MLYKVVIVDDFKMMREILEHAIEQSKECEIAAVFDSSGEAVGYCRDHSVDLVITDVMFPGDISGLDAAGQIKATHPETKILVITSMPEEAYLQRARAIGVESFWHKEVQEKLILDVINRTMAGESIYPDTNPVVALGNTFNTEFTEKELQILREMVAGNSNQEIAEKMHLRVEDVKESIDNMLKRTGFHSRLELLIKARSSGIAIHCEKEEV